MNMTVLARRITRACLAIAFILPLCTNGQSLPQGYEKSCLPKGQAASSTDVSQSVVANLNSESANTAVETVDVLTRTLRTESFPELVHRSVGVRSFHSRSDYFRTRFNLARFALFMPMHYYIEVNPALFQQQAPLDGVCAILAHELSHAVSLSHDNRIHRFSLVKLLSDGYTAKFERGTDLEAIHRGYGDGLKSYRAWIYTHIPPNKLATKQRNYFTPKEITALQSRLNDHPEMFQYWTMHVPLTLQQIEETP